MQALLYEYLIRRVWQSGRTLKNGADADIYRRMEHAHTDLETKVSYTSQAERETEYRKRFAAVREPVRAALLEGVNQIRHRTEEAEAKQLREITARLTLDFYDKTALDEIIRKANEIFQKRGLQVN